MGHVKKMADGNPLISVFLQLLCFYTNCIFAL